MNAIWLIARVLLWIGLVPIFAASVYLGFLALLARRRSDMPGSATTRFDIVVPAHNEESGIEQTVRSLRALAYPEDLFRILVIADNCSDRTAELARGAGAIVVERFDSVKRGKGYALSLAYEKSLAEGFANAVVVVDADTVVTPNLLSAFSKRFDAGAEAVQAEYAVPIGTDSWRSRLMVIAFTLFHAVRSSARERLGLSAGLRGNGMAFAVGLLRRIPSRAYSIVEDVEYGCEIGLSGVRVVYAEEAVVMSEMPATGDAARSQRERWEGGRMRLVSEFVPKLIGRGLRQGSGVMLDLAADLLVPPLADARARKRIGIGPLRRALRIWQRRVGLGRPLGGVVVGTDRLRCARRRDGARRTSRDTRSRLGAGVRRVESDVALPPPEYSALRVGSHAAIYFA